MNVADLPVRSRCAFALAVVERLPDALTDDPPTAEIARRGLAVSSRWVHGDAVPAEEIARYFESDTPDDLGMREGRQKDKLQRHALVAITAAIGYCAWQAYEAANRSDMSESLCEVGEQTVEEVVRKAIASGFVGHAGVEAAFERARASTDMASISSRGRCAFVLELVGRLPDQLTADPDGANLARRGLAEARAWLAGEPVDPERLAAYADSEGMDNLIVREHLQGDTAREDAHIAVTTAILYVAWHAYRAAGRGDTSQILDEVSEHSVDDVVRFARSSGFVTEADVDEALRATRATR